MILAEFIIPGLHLRDRAVRVPLDWSRPEGETIDLFLREVTAAEKKADDLPLLLFLQGGPGGKGPRPQAGGPPWLAEAVKTHRVLLLDQRGTGRSHRVTGSRLARFAGDGRAAADHLACFRADSIVADCEHIRRTLYGGRRWETLGQSYGGFLTLTYLSRAPEGLSACYVTGGLAGLSASAVDVYRRTYPRVAAKTAAYYARYPHDRAIVGRIADRIADGDVRLPDGDLLTVRRFQTLGLVFGMAPGFEQVHWIVDEAFAEGDDRLSDVFLAQVMAATAFDDNPLFVVLQESIYGQGDGATAWAAERVRAECPAFQETARPLLFTGEMMFPWMLDEIRSLRPFREAAMALAERDRHDPLYDPARLAANAVPVAAVVYFDDMYVDAGLSLETAAAVGNLKTWVTNAFEHDGVRQSDRVFARLREMVRETGGPRS